MPRRLLSIIALIWLAAIMPAQHARATTFAITAFYTTNQPGYDYWQSTGQPPPPIALFRPGTTRIYYYIAYSGAVPGQVAVQVSIRDAQGRTVAGYVHPLAYDAGSYMGYFFNRIAFVPGQYRYQVRLLLYPPGGLLSGTPLSNGAIVVSAGFGVAPGLVVPSFYTISMSDFRSSLTASGYNAYPRVVAYPADTTDIPFYFTYAGAIPRRTPWQIVVRDSTGAVMFRYPRRRFFLPYAAGWLTSDLNYVPAWPAGRYRLDLVLDGAIRRRTTFTVQPSALSACLSSGGAARGAVLYASDAAALAAWPGTRHAPPPRITVFPRGTRTIAWYFRYAGGKPGATYFQIMLTGASSGVALNSDLYTVQCRDGAWMGALTDPSGFISGSYELWADVDGQLGIVATTVRVR